MEVTDDTLKAYALAAARSGLDLLGVVVIAAVTARRRAVRGADRRRRRRAARRADWARSLPPAARHLRDRGDRRHRALSAAAARRRARRVLTAPSRRRIVADITHGTRPDRPRA